MYFHCCISRSGCNRKSFFVCVGLCIYLFIFLILFPVCIDGIQQYTEVESPPHPQRECRRWRWSLCFIHRRIPLPGELCLLLLLFFYVFSLGCVLSANTQLFAFHAAFSVLILLKRRNLTRTRRGRERMKPFKNWEFEKTGINALL